MKKIIVLTAFLSALLGLTTGSASAASVICEGQI